MGAWVGGWVGGWVDEYDWAGFGEGRGGYSLLFSCIAVDVRP